jgi:opacity protein-like surface antigen
MPCHCYLDHIAIHPNCDPVNREQGIRTMKKLIVALLAGAAAMSAAQAQSTAGGPLPRTYIGVGVATADHEDFGGVTGYDSNGYKASGKIFGGYEINQMWGVEAGYTDFRKADFSYNAGTAGAGNGNTKGYGVYVAAKASMPINDQFSGYGKVGVQHSSRELNSPIVNLSDSDNGLYGALGLQYNINQQVALTAEYERYGKSKAFGAKADVWTVAARYSF